MRRVFASLIGLFMLTSILGCHTAGVCDCVPYEPCAGGCCIGNGHPIQGAPIIRPEAIKAMPKGGEQE